MIKESIFKENTTVLKVCAPNIRAIKYLRQKLIKFQGKINEPTLMAGDFNTPLTETDKFI